MLQSYHGLTPVLGQDIFVAPGAQIIGDVTVGDNASIWHNVVLRGDSDALVIGARTNIQDLSLVHSDPGLVVKIGEDVTVGHCCILHGCTIERGALIGMGAVILNGAVIGENCLVAAHSLVTENKVFPPNTMIMGSPAKVVRDLTTEEIEANRRLAQRYVEKAAAYIKEATA